MQDLMYVFLQVINMYGELIMEATNHKVKALMTSSGKHCSEYQTESQLNWDSQLSVAYIAYKGSVKSCV